MPAFQPVRAEVTGIAHRSGVWFRHRNASCEACRRSASSGMLNTSPMRTRALPSTRFPRSQPTVQHEERL
ncbi:hypothetical protein [Lysobacter gummosus]|uniref:hypothetical protein n=1 Tax=Lysobacter gummosus TaxID=262324 RepID=UPI0036351941